MKKNDKNSKISGEIKKMLKKLKELELILSRSQAILCIWRFDQDWLPEFISDNISHFGYAKDDFLSGRVKWLEVVHQDDFPRLQLRVR